MMTFASREDAGCRLGCYLRENGVEVDLVVGLPRGGVVVAAQVAAVLRRPLQVLVVRKIGHPLHREFAVGAMAEKDVLILDEHAMGSDALIREKFNGIIREEEERLRQYETQFHRGGKSDLAGRAVLLVDDGLATGATTEAAVLSARKQGAHEITVAAPVASTNAVGRLKPVADSVQVLFIDPDFDAVGRYYDSFPQTTDDEVLALLNASQARS